MRKDAADWLRLARTENVGPVTFAQLLARYGTPAQALSALPGLASRGGRLAKLHVPDPSVISAELTRAEATGATLLCSGDGDYPAALKHIDAPPPVLWAKGDLSVLHKPAVALVGSRNASAAGLKLARDLAQGLGTAGYATVSGLARGIDGVVHTASLATGTIAVLGGGVDDVYPAEHQVLYEKIAATGCIVSDSPMGHTAQARDFPRRNRIIAGLAQGTVVVEAALKSGSLITARLALEMNREVMAVPGSPLDPRAKGCNDLLRQGAALVECADDVVAILRQIRLIREPSRDLFDGAPTDPAALDNAVAAVRDRLADLLSPTPVTRDELVRLTGASPAVIAAALIELELAGRATVLPGNVVTSA
jgi:DNA processing protein